MNGREDLIDLPGGSWQASPLTTPAAPPMPSLFEAAREGWRSGMAGPGILNGAYAKAAALDELKAGLEAGGYADQVSAIDRRRYGRRDPADIRSDAERDNERTDALLRLAGEARARNPKLVPAFAGVTDRIGLDAMVAQRRRATVAQSDAVYERTGGGGALAWWGGALASGVTDPLSWVPFGGGAARGVSFGRQIFNTAARQGLGNAGLQLLAEPLIARDAKSIGMDWGAKEIALDVGMAGLLGSVLGGGAEAVGGGLRVLNGQPAAREVLDAAYVVERDEWARSSSPFAATDEGAAAHGESLKAALAALEGDAPPVATVAAPLAAPRGLAQSSGTDAVKARIRHFESGGKDDARNPMPGQTAAGRYQFIDDTWLGLHKQVFGETGQSPAQIIAQKMDPAVQERLMDAALGNYTAAFERAGVAPTDGGLYLMHFLGPNKALEVLRSAPGTPMASLMSKGAIDANPGLLRGKTAGDVVAEMDRRMAGPRGAGVPTAMPGMTADRYRPGELTTDAVAMQYKAGGDVDGVTERLRGVKQWNPLLSGKVIVWEDAAGRRVVADGHQRLGLAKRAQAADPAADIWLDAITLREADGVTADQARVWAALKNIAEGSGTSVDAAKVLREAGEMFELPPGGIVRDARALARLGDEPFGAVINDVITAEQGAAIGRVLPDDEAAQLAMVDLLAATNPTTALQAETIVRQAVLDGFAKAEARAQLTMFGDADRLQTLFVQRARVLEDARRALKRDKTTFRNLVDNARRIEDTGNVLARGANAERLSDADRAIQLITTLANRDGPVRDALLAAVRLYPSANRRAAAVRQFLDGIGDLDLHAVARGMGESAGDGRFPDGAGRGSDVGEEARGLGDERAEEPGEAFLDFDGGASRAGLDDPHGPKAAELTQLIEHDVRRMAAAEARHPQTDETLGAAQQRMADLLAQFPGRDGRAPGTINIPGATLDATGKSRNDIRAAIVDMLLAGDDVARDRVAHIVLGPPASGKSSFADPLAAAERARIIDSDAAKVMLPEFEDGIGAMAVHEESAALAAQARREAMERGDNMVLPLVGRTASGIDAAVQELAQKGYRVYVHLVDLPNDQAVSRAIARFEQTGRLVDPDYIRAVGDTPKATFEQIVHERGKELAGYVHVSNDVPEGTAPRIVAASDQELALRLGGDRGSGGGNGAQGGGGQSGGDPRGNLRENLPVDPNVAALARQRAALGAEAPLRPTTDQAGHHDLPMFESVEQPALFAIGETVRDGERTPDLRSSEDVLAEFDADEAAIAAAKDCLL
ncbi:zeta toxin family protein [Sphingomonas sp. KC8]|uniref:zeta toxin family protein n=1 Tax=Sphingomonas sp. KC8 TaxID=1030157 RepID=UPI000248A439|nr:zeta toxin family protein [Sphingomonas sp. KC8]ARS27610.1 hypothetical protein KC8_09930 [Sphingomonas sp. KC8]